MSSLMRLAFLFKAFMLTSHYFWDQFPFQVFGLEDPGHCVVPGSDRVGLSPSWVELHVWCFAGVYLLTRFSSPLLDSFESSVTSSSRECVLA